MKNLKSYNESIKDFLKPKSEEQIKNSLLDLTPLEKLYKGCVNNILWLVKQSLDEGADPSENYNFFIRYSIQFGYLDIVKELLKDKRVDPSDYNNYAIRHSSENGYLDIVKELLKDERVDPSDYNNYAIRHSSENGYLDS